jgi:hypothetical protein
VAARGCRSNALVLWGTSGGLLRVHVSATASCMHAEEHAKCCS